MLAAAQKERVSVTADVVSAHLLHGIARALAETLAYGSLLQLAIDTGGKQTPCPGTIDGL